jgi:hypothetical protein
MIGASGFGGRFWGFWRDFRWEGEEAGPAVGWAYLLCVIDCCTREIVGWNLSHRCRTEEALDAVEQAVLEQLPAGSIEAFPRSANQRLAVPPRNAAKSCFAGLAKYVPSYIHALPSRLS